MLQPINLQMAHFNVEHSAQLSKEAIAAAQLTGQGQEVVQESLKRTQMVQASIAAAEIQKVKRRGDEGSERRREEQRRSFSQSEKSTESEEVEPKAEKKAPKSFDFYA